MTTLTVTIGPFDEYCQSEGSEKNEGARCAHLTINHEGVRGTCNILLGHVGGVLAPDAVGGRMRRHAACLNNAKDSKEYSVI